MHEVANHYARDDLLASIRRGVTTLGKTTETVTVDDLAPVDEFHVGGRVATRDFLDQVAISAEDHVLDLGCGIGGASRFAAHTYGCRVTGVDLTASYVEAGRHLCAWVGLEDRIALHRADALATGLGDARFDKAFMLHVGMNIEDKGALAREAWRLLRPGGVFGVYDVMQGPGGQGDLRFPVPWATVADTSRVAPSAVYRAALEAAGFEIVQERDRRDFALRFFEDLRAQASASSGPPPLGLHLLMGSSAPVKVQNMIDNITANRVTPVELIARKG